MRGPLFSRNRAHLPAKPLQKRTLSDYVEPLVRVGVHHQTLCGGDVFFGARHGEEHLLLVVDPYLDGKLAAVHQVRLKLHQVLFVAQLCDLRDERPESVYISGYKDVNKL
jgi:hypothetical protein